MPFQSNSPDFIQTSLLSEWIAKRPHIWSMDFLDERKLATFSKERGISFWDRHIRQLWQLGLLQADLLIGDKEIHAPELKYVGTDRFGRFLYFDGRQPNQRPEGWGNAIEELDFPSLDLKLQFHPFRFYVLYHLDRIFKLHIHPIQILSQKHYQGMLEKEMAQFQQWTAKSELLERVQYWNNISALAIATEPYTYTYIFGEERRPTSTDAKTHRNQIQEHWLEVSEYYKEAGIDVIEKARQDLCIAAESLDRNKDVHTILRLTQRRMLLKIRDHLGGALLLRVMAEMLRRATEEVFDIDLPEEDEKGFGYYRGHKETLYGSNRILDYNRKAAHQFLRHVGLDYSVQIRWYVEGETEYAALNSFFERFGSVVELINLGGHVAQKRGRGVAFRENLRLDLKTNIFSFISVDGDRSDYMRAVRKAAEDDEICGMFFITKPDFEFQNFTLAELEEILWEIAVENGASGRARQKLHNAISDAESGTNLMKAAGRALPELNQVSKGELWGKKLMEFAWSNREKAGGENESIKTRVIVEAVQAALYSLDANHEQTRKLYRVDPSTGKPVKRFE